ncbi:MAG: glycosyltransferase family 39 protein [Bacteroidales bacterium]|nr:glycosyltransferase family 39 protein [Bacteroidales bacterium]
MQINTKHSIVLLSTLFGIACFQGLLAFQGFDLCDEGFSLTFFQQIFNHPQSVEYNFLYWLSGIVGGLWLKLFPNAGIFAFRILGILIHLASLGMVIAIFRKRLPDWILAVSCVVLTLMFDFGVIAFEHSQLVVLFSLSAFYFLMKGIEENKLWPLLLSGFLLAVNVFSRLPNLTLWAWILLIPLFSNNWKTVWKQAAGFCTGLVLGGLAVLLTMLALGHLDIFVNSVMMMFNIAGEADNSHSFVQLFQTIIRNYITIARVGCIFIIPLLSLVDFQWHKPYFRWRSKDNLSLWEFWIRTFIICLFLFSFLKLYNVSCVFWLYALGFFAQAVLFWKTNDKNLRRIIVGSIVMMFLLPVGSDWYIGNMGLYSIWLAVPLTLWWGFSNMEKLSVLFNVKRWSFGILLGVFGIVQLATIANQAYFDNGSRFQKRYAIHHPIAKHIYTTKLRADVMNELIPALNQYIRPNDYVLAFEHIPMIHALTQSQPYLGISWPAIHSATFAQQLLEAEKTLPLPVVVTQHFESFPEWSAPQPDYYAENKPNSYKHNSGRTAVFNAFLQKHNYRQVWTNPYFSIWIVNP